MIKKVQGSKFKVQSPTIVFVGKTGEPPEKIINGKKVIELPTAEIQKKGFTHSDAAFLLKNYRNFYKEKVSKGKGKKL